MTPTSTIINARVPGYQGLQQIRIDAQALLKLIEPMDSASSVGQFLNCPESMSRVIGCPLGGVDLQINGGLGLAFTDVEIN
jgi:N-acetylglucosamine-6-phosphate deacetylase